MRCIVISTICILAICVSAKPRGKEYVTELFKGCAEQMGYDEETLATMWRNQDTKVGCVSACVLKMTGDWSDNKIDKEHVITSAKHERGDELDDRTLAAIGRCVDKGNTAADTCSKGMEYTKCVVQLML